MHSSSRKGGQEDEEDALVDDIDELQEPAVKNVKPVSKYRRENLRYLRGKPKKVSF